MKRIPIIIDTDPGVDDDLALRVAPAVIVPEKQFASISPVNQQTAFGLRLGINF